MPKRDEICRECPTRIYVGSQLACQEIGQGRHLCGESPLLPSPRLLALRMADPSARCPEDRWGDAQPCGPSPVSPSASERSGQRQAFKLRRREAIAKRRAQSTL